jgi:hypothetical protein
LDDDAHFFVELALGCLLLLLAVFGVAFLETLGTEVLEIAFGIGALGKSGAGWGDFVGEQFELTLECEALGVFDGAVKDFVEWALGREVLKEVLGTA